MCWEHAQSQIICPQDSTDYNGKTATSRWRSLGNSALTAWSRLASPVTRPSSTVFLRKWEGLEALAPHLWILAQNAWSGFNCGETPDKRTVRDSLQNNWPVFFHSVKARRAKDRLRNCRLGKTTETWKLRVLQDPGFGSWTRRGTLVGKRAKFKPGLWIS